ncbi:kinase [Streptomyces sp. NPDC048603]|uniref:GHMP family kinase ATP-binding protein n=1 Tax=Streptomyces sp. NPDC048603 TaxID=3365577 RepID=UPI00371ADE0A
MSAQPYTQDLDGPAGTTDTESPATGGEGASRSGCAGVGRAFGTFGELLQGVLPGTGEHFMVTSPVAAWSTATFAWEPDAGTVQVAPAHKRKAARLAQRALRAAGRPGGGQLRIGSELPEGKGMASSSADLVATARAVADAIGTRFTPADIENLLRDIEPTDGVMYDEIVAFSHREVRLRERLGTVPAMTVIAYDEGGTVDTISYNHAAGTRTEAETHEYARLLDQAREAIRDSDLHSLGRVATRSAELNARHNPRPSLPALRRICRDIDGLGIACAHSGTMLGILLPHDDPDTALKADLALGACASLPGTTMVYRSLGHRDDWSYGGLRSPEGAGSAGDLRPLRPFRPFAPGYAPATTA